MTSTSSTIAELSTVNVLMIGTGEYTTGYIGGAINQSDKSSGVVALTMFDLRRRKKVDQCAMVGRNGTNFPAIRQHMQNVIANVYSDMDITCHTYPADDVKHDPNAYKTALQEFVTQPGDVAIIFTPDDTHYEIAMECIKKRMHVLITKPIVQTLDHHHTLCTAAKEYNVLVGVEVHKRYDPFYTDIRDRIRNQQLGNQFQYMYSYMSQPKHQLSTFSAWAGKSSDISYYLNSHHIDWSEWTLHGIARPIRVTASSSTGVAYTKGMDTEDSITLTVQWENLNSNNAAIANSDSSKSETRPVIQKKSIGCAIYTSSWVAPKSDVHSQQRFFYMGNGGEVNIDQAHRGCTISTDMKEGLQSINPLFMKYTPSGTNGQFVGQNCYGVQSFEIFIDACRSVNAGITTPASYDDGSLATVHTTLQGTAILEAGRRSLDYDGCPMDIQYATENSLEPISIAPHQFKAN